jgi:hypothetical protein
MREGNKRKRKEENEEIKICKGEEVREAEGR